MFTVYDCTKSYLNSIEYSIRFQWPKAVDMQQKIMKQVKLLLEFKAYSSFRSNDKWRNVTCLETYKYVKTMHCCKTRIN